MFRPSDDATVFPFLVPSNFFAVVSLRQARGAADPDPPRPGYRHPMPRPGRRGRERAARIRRRRSTKSIGRILPYEIDGYGNYYCIDDGSVPSLLSLPYLDAVGPGDPLYLNTRRFVLSDSNPYYCIGKAASGPGGPHVGRDMIWPLGLIVQGLTSTDDQEVRQMPPYPAKDPRRHRLHARGV